MIFSISGCYLNNFEIEISDEKNSEVSETIKENKNVILETVYTTDSKAVEEDSIPISYDEMEEMLSDPERMIQEVLKTENGDAIVDFIYGLSTSDDPLELISLAENVLPQEGFEEQIAQFQEYKSKALHSRAISQNTLAWLSTTAAIQLAASILYAATPWFEPWAKSAAAVSLGSAAGIFGVAVLVAFNEFGGSVISFVVTIIGMSGISFSFALLSAQIASALGMSADGAAIISGVYAAIGIAAIIEHIILNA